MKILAFSGSLREQSYNTALIRNAMKMTPEGVTIELHPIDDLPLFNDDLVAVMPDVVKKLKDAVKDADAILIASPEYNYTIPGALKNMLDWVSRPHAENSMKGKPVAIMGAAGGMVGTARMQYDLRKVLFYLDTYPVNRPEVMVGMSKEKFDADLSITDEKTKEKVQQLVTALVDWTKKLKTLA